MRVGEIDVTDDAVLHEAWSVGKESDEHDRAYPTYWPWRVAKPDLQRPSFSRVHVLAASEADQLVGMCSMFLPVRDNLHLAIVGLYVRPAHRRRGIGSALLDAAFDVAREEDRRVVIGEVHTPMEGPRAPGWAFMAGRGFEPSTSEFHRVADLPVDESVLESLADEARPHHESYRLVQWGNRMPDEYVDGYCRLMSTFVDEAPMGDLEIEAENYDEERIRTRESKHAEQGRTWYTTAALSDVGSLVGVTEMCVSTEDSYAWQDSTIVARAARGHRLGLAMKVANLRRLQAEQPGATSAHSWNAEENGPMVAINDRLGFRPVERSSEMQRKL